MTPNELRLADIPKDMLNWIYSKQQECHSKTLAMVEMWHKTREELAAMRIERDRYLFELENLYSSDELKSQVGQLNKSLQQANSTITDLRSMIYPNAAEINHVKEMHECLQELADCVGNLSPGVSGCHVPSALINKAIELIGKYEHRRTRQ